MLDFDIQRSDRVCSVTGRSFQPGDTYYSALLESDGGIERKDYGEESWPGPPESCLGWWKSCVPTLQSLKMKWAPNDVMLHYFDRLQGDATKADTKYVLSLLMLRRRIVKQTAAETRPDGREELTLYCPRNEREYQVEVVPLSGSQIKQIQTELADLLYCPGQ